jgi:hypothetical protein
MRRILAVPLVLAAIAVISSASFGQNGGYVAVVNDSTSGNSVTTFKVTSAGEITLLKTFETGGVGIGGEGFIARSGVAIESNAHCVFVADAGSNDIAAFAGPSFNRVVPNFSNSQLRGDEEGIGLAVDPAGKFLYSAWSTSSNLAVLAIASDCSLTLVGNPIPQPDTVTPLAVSHNGKVLAVSYPDIGAVQAYSTSSNGTLTPIGPALSFPSAIPACASDGCYPTGADATDDGKYWVWGNAYLIQPSSLSATLTPTGFTNATLETYSQSTLQNVEVPRFSPAAAEKDAGNLYFSAVGFGGLAGIIVTNFNAGSVSYAGETVDKSAFFATGIGTVGTAGTGSPVVQIVNESSGDNVLDSYTVSGTNLTPAGTFTNPVVADSFSLSTFPTRP